MMMRLIISVVLLVGCTATLNKKADLCPKFYTYMCESVGSHEDCWCEDTRHLEGQLKLIQQQAFKRDRYKY